MKLPHLDPPTTPWAEGPWRKMQTCVIACQLLPNLMFQLSQYSQAFLSLMLWASVSYDFSPSELDRSRLFLRLDGLVEDFSAILASNNIPIEGFKMVFFSERDAPTFQSCWFQSQVSSSFATWRFTCRSLAFMTCWPMVQQPLKATITVNSPSIIKRY